MPVESLPQPPQPSVGAELVLARTERDAASAGTDSAGMHPHGPHVLPPAFLDLLRRHVHAFGPWGDVAQRAGISESRLRMLANAPMGGRRQRRLSRKALPTQKEAEHVARALNLGAASRREFVMAAAIARSSERVRLRIELLTRRIGELETALSEL